RLLVPTPDCFAPCVLLVDPSANAAQSTPQITPQYRERYCERESHTTSRSLAGSQPPRCPSSARSARPELHTVPSQAKTASSDPSETLELMTGIEPVTSPLPRECSTN